MADVPADTSTWAQLDGFGPSIGSYSGALESPGDHDWIKVYLYDVETYKLSLSFLNTGSTINGDSVLAIRDSNGNVLATNDDGGVGANSFLSFNPATSGYYYIDISENANNDTGDYSFFIEQNSIGTIDKQLTSGNDNYSGFINERILGGKGADYINIFLGSDALGEQGNDIILGNSAQNHISGGLGDDTLDGGLASDLLLGDAGNDEIFGDDGFDLMWGGAGSDHLYGGRGADQLHGGSGKDFLSGGADIDYFYFEKLADSKPGTQRDVISDFSSSDLINLVTIDAKAGVTGNQAFKFIGMQGFHHSAGELRYAEHDLAGVVSDNTIIWGDVNGDGKADIAIALSGLHTLNVFDFQL